MQKRLRYADLVALGIVNNRVTLQNWINKEGFPRGAMIGANTRVWDESAVTAWLKSRPTAPKPKPPVTKPESEWKGRRGRRPSKGERVHETAT